ncbi:carboxymuconolactone decarboxylase family protein [Dactylosporangium sp. NPDC048998]|uniref:carboxymuconolactone decarboxylase family protein n=1 Tax=Dactylosporangium sp. NPDC048998 TaxID=3363976 RepID=UPI0037170B7D
MTYLDTPADAQARDDVARMYDEDRAKVGYVQNLTRLFALRPDVLDAWVGLSKTIRRGMDLRRYELVTLAAAKQLRSSYCSLAHGEVLRDRFYDAKAVQKIATDHHHADLDPVDVAVMDFAGKTARDAASITADDVDTLRQHGLSDDEIFQVILAAAARCFFSTVIDAAGAEPDFQYRASIEPELLQVLTVGRPVSDEA